MRVGGQTPEALERVRGVMERQIGHMVRLIDDLLDVSRITSGKIALQKQRTSLSELVEGAIEATRTFINDRRITFAVHMPEPACVLDVDRTRFIQILSNLLHNAAKFTPSGGKIEVRARLELGAGPGRQLVLTVSDNGIGISPRMLPHVFELFTQDKEAMDVARSGLGIGLTLVRRLVEMHGGTVDAKSEGRGRGTQISMRMPVAEESAEVTAAQPRRQGEAGRRVLVIDDNEDSAEMLAMFVEQAGGESRTAHDGASGLAAAAEFRPEVVLLDIGMPGMDGYETCRRLRASPSGAQLFIAALTGWGQDRDKQRAAEAGFDVHLTKPVDPAAVMKLLSDPKKRTELPRTQPRPS
jgi:CheY-like chemotaxis protein